MLEVTFNIFTTERLFRLGQNDRADDLMTSDLRGQKRLAVRKLRVGEFYKLTARTHFFPFILHLFGSDSWFCFLMAGGLDVGPKRTWVVGWLEFQQPCSTW
jgi:hypothetical protein